MGTPPSSRGASRSRPGSSARKSPEDAERAAEACARRARARLEALHGLARVSVPAGMAAEW